MCRWMAWHGQPIRLDELLLKTQHGLIDQSLHSRMGAETTNGDGFGVGWYGTGDGPGVYHSIAPAWGDRNLRELAAQVTSPLFLSHVRATSGTAIQDSNCHPFRHGRWLLVHNGVLGDFLTVRRDLVLAIAPELFSEMYGSTDSEVLFLLALTFGLEADPIGGVARAIGLVEEVAAAHGVEHAFQGTVGVSDGERLWAIRYSTEGRSRTLFASADADALQQLHPDNPRLARLLPGDRLVVSEPFNDLPGDWHEIPEATAMVVLKDGAQEFVPFVPVAPERPAAALASGG
jgi:predicted glutamine amidotransferase